VQKRVTSASADVRSGSDRDARGIAFIGDDAALVAALRSGHPAALAAFHDRYATHMLRMLVRVLGQDRDLEDVLHEVFVRALSSLRQVPHLPPPNLHRVGGADHPALLLGQRLLQRVQGSRDGAPRVTRRHGAEPVRKPNQLID
jgi:hypothetical protein